MPDSNIKSMDAFLQKIDFSSTFDLTKSGTDFDYACRTLNDKKVVFEVKKETPNHTVGEVIGSAQWQKYQDFFKPDVYLVYATHNCVVSVTEPIPAEKLTVRYAELNGKSLNLKNPMPVREFLEVLNEKKSTVATERYYIKVKYPNGTIEYANRVVNNKKWSSPVYNARFMNFVSADTVSHYIEQRYEKAFNQKYVYEIWFIDKDGQHKKVLETKYGDKITL